jgi:AAA family ATP:ADP antiporter
MAVRPHDLGEGPFAALAASPLLILVIAFQALQRTANFAISNPAREVLFTVVDREEKYKAKYLIDGVVFRGGDALFGWLFNLLRSAGAELATISAATVPVALGWLALALTLGKAQERRATPTKAQAVEAVADADPQGTVSKS